MKKFPKKIPIKTPTQAILDATSSIQRQTPDAAHAANAAALQSAYLAAKETARTAPKAVADAEKAYYTFAVGSDHYRSDVVQPRLNAEKAALKKRIGKAHDTYAAQVADALAAYTTSARYAANVDGVILAQLTDVIRMAEAVQDGAAQQVTNSRKSSFLITERGTVAAWDSYLTVGVWVLAAVYAKAHVLPNPASPVPWAMLALVAASPWLLGLAGWLVGRRVPPFNAYTTFSG